MGRHTLTADEPVALGGGDAGPPPFGLLLSGLAACTSITLRMYADKKGFGLSSVHLDLRIARGADGLERVTRRVRVPSSVTDEQLAKLAEIAEKTPVTKVLKRAVEITTTFERES